MVAYVLNKHGKPLMPCSPGKARRLLKEGKAKVVGREPFTIKLLYGSPGYKQEVKLTVDAGSNHIGAAARTESGKVLYASETDTRKDISDKLTQRRSYRRTRRGRKLRYRAPRFHNRVRKDEWLTPTVRSKIQAHVSEIEFIKSILPVSEVIIETATFDIHRLSDPEVRDYQEGRQKGFYNTKAFVLSRDSHNCQGCKEVSFTEAYGFETKWNRERLGLPKIHYMDAICVGLNDGEVVTSPDIYFKKVRIARRDYQKTRGRRSEEKIPTGKIKGIRKFDKVEWKGGKYFVKGRMSTGYAILMDIGGKKIEFKPIPKLENMKRISARKSCLTHQIAIGKTTSNSISSSSLNARKNSSIEKGLANL